MFKLHSSLVFINITFQNVDVLPNIDSDSILIVQQGKIETSKSAILNLLRIKKSRIKSIIHIMIKLKFSGIFVALPLPTTIKPVSPFIRCILQQNLYRYLISYYYVHGCACGSACGCYMIWQ